jgi:hypothetical protein
LQEATVVQKLHQSRELAVPLADLPVELLIYLLVDLRPRRLPRHH